MILAREIDRNPKVLIAAQPTRGLDVGAIEFVHRRLVEERDEGGDPARLARAEEILSLSDRILVMFEGEIVGEFPPSVSEEELGIAMIGGGRKAADLTDLPAGGPRPRTTKPPDGKRLRPSFATRYAVAQKAGGIVVPLLTVVLAFLIGGAVVFATTGDNPLSTYKAIFEGAGLNWFIEVGSYEIRVPFTDAHVWFPWNVDDIESTAAFNLQQTLINFVRSCSRPRGRVRFRCGMFNIGGQGQYLAGAIMAVWIGSELPGLPGFVHVLAAIVAGALVGAVWAGIAGFLKATVGAHEVISTIMLNWIAIWIGVFLFGLGGPLQNDTEPFVRSRTTSSTSRSCRSSGATRSCRRSTSASSSRSPRSSSTGSRSTGRRSATRSARSATTPRRRATAASRSRGTTSSRWRSPAFAGLAGAIDTTGWAYRINTNDVQISSQIAFVGIAVALLGRNKAIGIGLGDAVRVARDRDVDPEPRPEIFKPELASNLTVMIQGSWCSSSAPTC